MKKFRIKRTSGSGQDKKNLRVKWTPDTEQDKKFLEQLQKEEENSSDICNWTGNPHGHNGADDEA